MSTHYLIDAHTPVLANSPINDVRLSGGIPGVADDGSIVNGNFVVRVGDSIGVEDPTSFSDLITKKYAGLLASYPGFSNIIFDALTDDTNIAKASPPNYGTTLGLRGTISVSAGGGSLSTTVVDVSPAVVTQAIVVWEAFKYVYVDDKTNRTFRIYDEVAPESVDVDFTATNNFGAAETPTSGSLVTMATPGSLLRLRFTGATGQNRIFLGSWAVIY